MPGIFHVRTKVICGLGCSSRVGEEVLALGVSRVFVVTDRGVAESGIIQYVLSSLEASGVTYTLFDGTEPEPSATLMDGVAKQIVEAGAEGVVAVGGGSSLDTGKAAAVVASNGGSILDFVGEGKVRKPPLPVVSLPTTAGTGSEVTWHISVNDTASKKKVTVRSPLCATDVALLDPQLLASVPPRVAAATGIDALAHCVESYVSTRGAWQLTDLLAAEGIRLVGKFLRPFVANRSNVEAAEGMLLAALFGGMCLSHARTGIGHQMARPLGARYHIPHGLANALVLPYVMRHAWCSNPAKYAQVAKLLGERVEGLSEVEAARMAAEAVGRLCCDVGLPTTLREVGVAEDSLPELAQDAMQGRPEVDNPIQGGFEDVLAIYRSAFRGE